MKMSAAESDHVKISIINLGSVWKAKVCPSTKINKLISLAVSHFLESGVASSSRNLKYKLVSVRTRGVLAADKSLSEEDLKDNDEVILVRCHSRIRKDVPDLRGPTEADIYEATKHLEAKNTKKPHHQPVEDEDSYFYSDRFSKDSPRIFVSLIEYAAHLLAFAPNGMEIFTLVNKEIISKRDPILHGPHVKQLMEMGFSERMASKALVEKRMNVTEAAEWLLEQSLSFPDNEQQEAPTTSQLKPLPVHAAFQELLESSLKKRQESFKINPKYFESLKQKGYDEKDIENALRETDNNLKAAMSRLLGHTYPNSSRNNKMRLDPNGSMFKALIASEVIQLNIKKPKFILALFSMLEDPNCLSLWLKDHEVCHILNHIILIHNTESSGGRNVT